MPCFQAIARHEDDSRFFYRGQECLLLGWAAPARLFQAQSQPWSQWLLGRCFQMVLQRSTDCLPPVEFATDFSHQVDYRECGHGIEGEARLFAYMSIPVPHFIGGKRRLDVPRVVRAVSIRSLQEIGASRQDSYSGTLSFGHCP